MLVDTIPQFTNTVKGLTKETELVVDVETNGLDPFEQHEICGVGVGTLKSDKAFYFPFRHKQGNNLPLSLLPELMKVLSDQKRLVGYNLKFDLHFLEREGLSIKDTVLSDALVLVRLTTPSTIRDLDLTNTIKRSYGEAAAQYDIDTKKYLRKNKWTKDFSEAPPDILGPYCEEDVIWTTKIYKDRLVEMKKSNQQQVWQLMEDLTPVLFNMERHGIRIDSEYAKVAMEKIGRRKDELQSIIHEMVGDFNLNSPQQMGEILNKNGIYSPVLTPKGAQSWSEGALVKINHPVAGLIRQYRTLEKLRSTYLEPNVWRNVLHTGFCNWGTATGRLSSRQPNLQNIPRNHFKLRNVELDDNGLETVRQKINALLATKGEAGATNLSPEVLETWAFIGDESYDEADLEQLAIRRLFTPREGYKLVGFDYSQMEVRVFLSYIHNDEIRQLLSKDDVDFHGEAAKLAFDTHEDADDYKFYRQMAKAITFGTIYGIGNKKLAIQLGTTPQEAGIYKRRYFAGLKGSKDFFDSVVNTVETRGWIKNRYGRVYKIPRDVAYKGVNYLVQGTSADIMNERLIEVHKALEGTSSRVLLQVHDEIICEIHESDIHTIPEQICDIMRVNSLQIPLQVDMELCDPSWASKIDMSKALTNGHVPQQRVEDFIDWD